MADLSPEREREKGEKESMEKESSSIIVQTLAAKVEAEIGRTVKGWTGLGCAVNEL